MENKRFPNLALMKISAYHKKIGNTVEWWDKDKNYDTVYSSKVFDYTPTNLDLPENTIIGGTGYENYEKLPGKIDICYPDYSIYPDCDFALGFLTRGCINSCDFCVVPKKEGLIHPCSNWKLIVRNDTKKLVLLDNNILASDYGVRQLMELSQTDFKLDLNQGMDITLLNEDIVKILAEIKWIKYIRFSCDREEQLPYFVKMAELFMKYGISLSRVFIYVLVRKDLEEADMRIQTLHKIYKNFNIYAQAERNKGIEPDKFQLEFTQRYVYGRSYKKETWDEYSKRNGFSELIKSDTPIYFGNSKNRLQELVDSAPPNLNIINTLLKAHAILSVNRRCAVSVSGGSDSDIVIDLLELIKPDSCELCYIFFDTGLDYFATKKQLIENEKKYGIEIKRLSPEKTLPSACKEYGIPFICKDVSENIYRLQKHNFDWSDTPENATSEKYGRCKSALDWYFNRRSLSKNGKSRYSINNYKFLKDFIKLNPPKFIISDKCCDFVKKFTSESFNREYMPSLTINGMRRAEGGRRSGSIKSCFTKHNDKADDYRPLWYWTDGDKALYKEWRGIKYSDCYEVYGLKRTGCVGCPCNSRAENELEKVEPFEPNVVKAARNIFGASYEYKRMFVEFKK